MKWSAKYDLTVSAAIAEFNLRRLGWRGFEQLPWVSDLLRRFPAVHELATHASIHDPKLEEKASALFDSLKDESVMGIVCDYFAGKMALEELSCLSNGAGAGACDKRAGFVRIWSLLVPA